MKLQYQLMELPIQGKSYENMTKKEATVMYNWFLNEIPNRIQLLTKYYDFDNFGKNKRLDYSPESLISIWEWFIPKIESRELTNGERVIYNTVMPQWAQIGIPTKMFTVGCMSVSVDIAIYLAEVFIRNNEEISWGIKYSPKSFLDVNRPILKGFIKNVTMNPVSIIHVLMLRVLNRKEININSLYDIYHIWLEKIKE